MHHREREAVGILQPLRPGRSIRLDNRSGRDGTIRLRAGSSGRKARLPRVRPVGRRPDEGRPPEIASAAFRNALRSGVDDPQMILVQLASSGRVACPTGTALVGKARSQWPDRASVRGDSVHFDVRGQRPLRVSEWGGGRGPCGASGHLMCPGDIFDHGLVPYADECVACGHTALPVSPSLRHGASVPYSQGVPSRMASESHGVGARIPRSRKSRWHREGRVQERADKRVEAKSHSPTTPTSGRARLTENEDCRRLNDPRP